jgi:hypothetical protein
VCVCPIAGAWEDSWPELRDSAARYRCVWVLLFPSCVASQCDVRVSCCLCRSTVSGMNRVSWPEQSARQRTRNWGRRCSSSGARTCASTRCSWVTLLLPRRCFHAFLLGRCSLVCPCPTTGTCQGCCGCYLARVATH